jgi:hypothetical protein
MPSDSACSLSPFGAFYFFSHPLASVVITNAQKTNVRIKRLLSGEAP